MLLSSWVVSSLCRCLKNRQLLLIRSLTLIIVTPLENLKLRILQQYMFCTADLGQEILSGFFSPSPVCIPASLVTPNVSINLARENSVTTIPPSRGYFKKRDLSWFTAQLHCVSLQ